MTIPSSTLKSALRQDYLARRKTVSPEAAEAAARAIAAHFLAERRFGAARNVAGYLPVRGEASPLPMLEALAQRTVPTALPVVEVAGKPLTFHAWKPGEPLMEGAHRIAIPKHVEVLTPELILVPLLAFDANGQRLGYGGGYYDRTLAALRQSPAPPLAVGIAYACQEAPALPAEPFDQRLDAVITEAGMCFFR